MLHEDTKILTLSRDLQKVKDLTSGEDIVTLYGNATIQKVSFISGPITELILENSEKIYCSPDQKFLIKNDIGYVFKVPLRFEPMVTFTHLMELRKIQQVNHLSSGSLVKVHVKNDYSLLINGLYICKS